MAAAEAHVSRPELRGPVRRLPTARATERKTEILYGISIHMFSKNKKDEGSGPSKSFATPILDRPAKRLLSKRELATALNVSPRTIENWLAERRIPQLRLSARLTRFNLPKVEAALARYEVREVGRARI